MQVIHIFEHIAFHGSRYRNIINQASGNRQSTSLSQRLGGQGRREVLRTSSGSHIRKAQRRLHVDRPAPRT